MSAALKAKIAAAEAAEKLAREQKNNLKKRAKAMESKAARQLDAKRKILAGSMLLQLAQHGDDRALQLLDHLDAFLSRPQDRAAFDLPPRPAGGAAQAGGQESAQVLAALSRLRGGG